MSPQTFIFYGRSGCGKGTQAALLKEYLEKTDPNRPVLYLETGQLLREFVKKGGYSSELVKGVIEAGGLLPEVMPIWVLTGYLVEHVTGNEHIIFDGVSRRPHEAPILDSALRFYKRENPKVVLLEVSREWARERLFGRGRNDDSKKDIDRRLDWYERDVIPTLKFFEGNPTYDFLRISGEKSIEEVHADLIEKAFGK